jgi:hypothetical protein
MYGNMQLNTLEIYAETSRNRESIKNIPFYSSVYRRSIVIIESTLNMVLHNRINTGIVLTVFNLYFLTFPLNVAYLSINMELETNAL